MSGTALERVRERIAVDGDPLLAEALVSDPPAPDGPTAALPDRLEADLAIGIEAIREGHLLHGGASRLLAGDDPDLDLLAGDRLYALGLELVAGTGDEASIRALSELIRAAAEARADGSGTRAEQVWTEACSQFGKQAC